MAEFDRRALALEAQRAAAAAKRARAEKPPEAKAIASYDWTKRNPDKPIPRRVYGAPRGVWVTHPTTGRSVLKNKLSKKHFEMYLDRIGRKNAHKGPQIMPDIPTMVCPLDNSILNTRRDIRTAMQRAADRGMEVEQVGDVRWEDQPVTAPEPTDREYEEAALIAYEKWEAGYKEDGRGEAAGLASKSDRSLRVGSV